MADMITGNVMDISNHDAWPAKDKWFTQMKDCNFKIQRTLQIGSMEVHMHLLSE